MEKTFHMIEKTSSCLHNSPYHWNDSADNFLEKSSYSDKRKTSIFDPILDLNDWMGGSAVQKHLVVWKICKGQFPASNQCPYWHNCP